MIANTGVRLCEDPLVRQRRNREILAMTKPAKLYALLMQSHDRDVTFRDFVKLLEAFGFLHARTKGSHQSFRHPDCPRLMVIQPKGKDAKRYQLREFLDLVKEYGLELDA